MAGGFKPTGTLNVPLVLLIPTYSEAYGVPSKAFPTLDKGIAIFGSFRTFGGTERDVNGLLAVEDTAVIETWYRPDIKSDCRIAVPQTGAVYEIINQPENIEMRSQYLVFKVRRVKGAP